MHLGMTTDTSFCAFVAEGSRHRSLYSTFCDNLLLNRVFRSEQSRCLSQDIP